MQVSTTGSAASTVGALNPYRYRSYRYDAETGLYYLNSRYYDPEIGRFINTDHAAVSCFTPMGLTDKNLFAYCDNNPVVRKDADGDVWGLALAAAVAGVAFRAYGNTRAGRPVQEGLIGAAIGGAALGLGLGIVGLVAGSALVHGKAISIAMVSVGSLMLDSMSNEAVMYSPVATRMGSERKTLNSSNLRVSQQNVIDYTGDYCVTRFAAGIISPMSPRVKVLKGYSPSLAVFAGAIQDELSEAIIPWIHRRIFNPSVSYGHNASPMMMMKHEYWQERCCYALETQPSKSYCFRSIFFANNHDVIRRPNK